MSNRRKKLQRYHERLATKCAETEKEDSKRRRWIEWQLMKRN